jgi:hypothetical protein
VLNSLGLFFVFIIPLKGQSHEIFCFRIFHESPSSKPLKITLGSFLIFSKICGDIGKSRYTTSVNNTSGKFVTGGKIAAGINNTGGKLTTGINDTGGNLPPVSTTPAHQCR